MADEVREYIRAAQAAELRGDNATAVDCLKKAAAIYRNSGNTARALQVLRHASRLDSTREDIREEVRRLEWIPETPLSRAVDENEGDEEERRALAPLEALEQGQDAPQAKLIERGPTRADPSLSAWCSFCCKPKTEVGDLVAGPAGSFICRSCVIESAKLLELAGLEADGRIGADEIFGEGDEADGEARGEKGPETSEPRIVGQDEAMRVLEGALRIGARRVLILGPEGSGKTAYLQELARKGLGQYVQGFQIPAGIAPEQRLLLDGLEQLDDLSLRRLARMLEAEPQRPMVMAIRGQLVEASIAVSDDKHELPIHSTRELVEATSGKLPLELAERVQVAAAFRAPAQESLSEIARQLLGKRAAELFLSEDLVAALVAQAARSARGAHELRALIDRLPPGSWNLKDGKGVLPQGAALAPAASKKRPKRRKGPEE